MGISRLRVDRLERTVNERYPSQEGEFRWSSYFADFIDRKASREEIAQIEEYLWDIAIMVVRHQTHPDDDATDEQVERYFQPADEAMKMIRGILERKGNTLLGLVKDWRASGQRMEVKQKRNNSLRATFGPHEVHGAPLAESLPSVAAQAAEQWDEIEVALRRLLIAATCEHFDGQWKPTYDNAMIPCSVLDFMGDKLWYVDTLVRQFKLTPLEAIAQEMESVEGLKNWKEGMIAAGREHQILRNQL
jgi:hypothetical protein